MKRRRKLRDKIAHSLYHNCSLQKSATEIKKSLDEVAGLLENGMKKKGKK